MIIQGKQLIVIANGEAVAAAKSCTLKIKATTLPTASPLNGRWSTSIIDRLSWSVSTGCLVQSLVRSVAIAGTTVALKFKMEGGLGNEFSGFVDNVPITSGAGIGRATVVWDKTRKIFLGMYSGPIYYQRWTGETIFINPNDYDMFNYNGTTYVYYDGDLHAEELTGNAHVVGLDVGGSLGNLAQSSFEFIGTGPLTPTSLPSI